MQLLVNTVLAVLTVVVYLAGVLVSTRHLHRNAVQRRSRARLACTDCLENVRHKMYDGCRAHHSSHPRYKSPTFEMALLSAIWPLSLVVGGGLLLAKKVILAVPDDWTVHVVAAKEMHAYAELRDQAASLMPDLAPEAVFPGVSDVAVPQRIGPVLPQHSALMQSLYQAIVAEEKVDDRFYR